MWWLITSEAVLIDDIHLLTEVQVSPKVGCATSEFCGLYPIISSNKLTISHMPHNSIFKFLQIIF